MCLGLPIFIYLRCGRQICWTIGLLYRQKLHFLVLKHAIFIPLSLGLLLYCWMGVTANLKKNRDMLLYCLRNGKTEGDLAYLWL